jgi:tetratricopeptide (TPR) repeat protein
MFIRILALVFVLGFSVSLLAGQEAEVPRSVLHQAAGQFQQGDLTAAEHTLREALQKASRDPAALSLLGVVLDAQKRYGEAESAYRQALAVAPDSPGILNNLGNHYLAEGKSEQARAAFLKVVAADPHYPNANLQLAQLSVAGKQGAPALEYLDRLPPEAQTSPSVEILRAQALKLTGQDKAATNLLGEVESKSGSDPSVAFSVGVTFANWQRYTEAENAFNRALDADPTNFDILYNLGLAAQHAGDLTRAQEVYGIALRQRPNDPDCLFNLAGIYNETGHPDEAILPLMQAYKAAPNRPDILFALAQTCQETGFYADAVTAINEYLKLKPHDDVARRERGFCLIRSAKLDEGMADLVWYTQQHPKDARGLYELAIAETVRERDKALVDLNRALAIDPKFHAARHARAALYYQMGKTDQSIADLKIVLAAEPDNSASLDALGEDYERLGQFPQAAEIFDRAYKLAPKDPRILTHYAHLLLRLGRKEDAEKMMVVFRALGPEEGRRRPYGGLFDFLNLPPQEQYAKYMENLQRSITTRPDAPNLRVQLGKSLLHEGKADKALESFRAVLKLTSDPAVLATCGKALFDDGQYAASLEFLEPAVAADPADAEARLDLAMAVFHSAGPEEALKRLAETPSQQRKGDYFLLRAQILDAMQRPEQAAEALDRAFDAAPTSSDLYFEAALFLIKHKQYSRAVQLLDLANRVISDAPQLQLIQAMAYGMEQQFEDSVRVLTKLETRWPEWSLPYELHGISLETRTRSQEAVPLLETAISLGAQDSSVYYYLASAISHARPDDVDAARQAIEKALELNPDDPYIQSLAGKIAYRRKAYPVALEHLTAALRLWPEMIEAHETLAGVYRAMGEREKSAEALKEIVRIKQENPTADQTPPLPTRDLLFSVPGPSRPPS